MKHVKKCKKRYESFRMIILQTFQNREQTNKKVSTSRNVNKTRGQSNLTKSASRAPS